MGTRHRSRRRYRFLLWLDETGGPLQWAVATYVDDDKLDERTSACEPFDSPRDALRDALRTLDIQLTLW